MAINEIFIKGARQHNLKNIDLTLPREKLIVITGVSGSGKSTLAFDTIYAEGQRRYVESLSAYARQFLELMDKPEVDFIEGLSPAIAIEQRKASQNPRSTVATATEIYDYLRLLFSRLGTPYCYQCGQPIAAQSIPQMVEQILNLPSGTRFTIFAPLIVGKKGEHYKLLQRLRQEGYSRVRINGELFDLDEPLTLDKNKRHQIEALIDRLVVKPGLATRLTDSLELATKLSGGLVTISVFGGEELLFSQHSACRRCGISYPELTPQMFSFNSPQGACPTCSGLGTQLVLDPQLIVPDPELSLREGAILPWAQRQSLHHQQILEALEQHYDFSIRTPFRELPPRVQQVLLYGSGAELIRFTVERNGRRVVESRVFEGVIPYLERRYRETDSSLVREEIERFMTQQPCPDCGGARLRREVLAVRLQGRNIHEVTQLTVGQAQAWIQDLNLTPGQLAIGRRVLKEISDRLGFMLDVGLDYLTLDRPTATLSGGESQRIRLATQIGSKLTGVLYVLDEPSIGLHQRDNLQLLQTLKTLRDLGNTVIVVEHDPETIHTADYLVDMGPGAGNHGGEVVFAGTVPELYRHPTSLTGAYLSGRRAIEVPGSRRRPQKFLRLVGAKGHNLKSVDLHLPLGVLTCVTGVSGSGKSTLIMDTLYKALCQKLYRAKERPEPFTRLEGLEHIDKVINIDQSPIGRTPRSNPATYTGLFTLIRDLFARLPEAGPGATGRVDSVSMSGAAAANTARAKA